MSRKQPPYFRISFICDYMKTTVNVIFPLQKPLFFSLLMKRPLGSLKPKHVAISKCFLLHHTGFFSAGFAGGQWGVHACHCVKAGAAFVREAFCDTCKGTNAHQVRHQALCLSIAVLTGDMLVSHGGVRRCRAVDICAVQDPSV